MGQVQQKRKQSCADRIEKNQRRLSSRESFENADPTSEFPHSDRNALSGLNSHASLTTYPSLNSIETLRWYHVVNFNQLHCDVVQVQRRQ